MKEKLSQLPYRLPTIIMAEDRVAISGQEVKHNLVDGQVKQFFSYSVDMREMCYMR